MKQRLTNYLPAVFLLAIMAVLAVGQALALWHVPPDLAMLGFAGTTLAADLPRDYAIGNMAEIPVIAADIIYQGAAVGDNGSGYARPLVAGDPFIGFAEVRVDNSTGAAGDKYVHVKPKGRVKLPISALAITDKGKDVYASDDNTFTLTAGSNTRIGYVAQWLSTGYGLVEFEATHGVIVELTDSSGGTAADTIAAIGGTYSQTEVRNAVASLAAKINGLIRRLGN